MVIKIFNTLSRKEEVLTTLEPDHLRMYVCGPTVYDRPHLGNARSVVVYDMLYRFFRRIYPRVTYVRNITDVDDKINLAAKERQISIGELTKEVTGIFHQDMDALHVLRPTIEPRATDHISDMIQMIEELIKNGNAYVNDGHVLFDVKSYQDYGALSRRSLDEMIAGSRVEVASYKKDPLDFVLWKPANIGDDASSIFASPWGEGRPGWHIECSAMSSKYLGADFDIHGGGADLQFPHHENEIAQSRCAQASSHYARFWIHNGFLTVNGEKMSKSLKNFITVRDLLNKNINGIVIRYLLLATHYRKPFDYNQKTLDDAKKSIDKFYALFNENDLLQYQVQKAPAHETNHLMDNILRDLSDDLNTSKVLALLHAHVPEVKISNNKKSKYDFMAALDFLGLLDDKFFAKDVANKIRATNNIDENYIIEQIALRFKAKTNKDWVLADKIRQDLLAQNIILEDVVEKNAAGEKSTKTIWKVIK